MSNRAIPVQPSRQLQSNQHNQTSSRTLYNTNRNQNQSHPSLTRTIHVGYNSRQTDRASLFLYFRAYQGFDLIGFYDRFCFVRFKTGEAAALAQTLATPHGVTTYEAAKQYYEVPYPQPDDDNRVACKILHITHLPTNYTKNEIEKIFGMFPGFSEAHFYGKYGYAYFDSESHASHARQVLRVETNLVVSFAKSAPKPISALEAVPDNALAVEQQAPTPRFSVIVKRSVEQQLQQLSLNQQTQPISPMATGLVPTFEQALTSSSKLSSSFDKFDPTPGAGRPSFVPIHSAATPHLLTTNVVAPRTSLFITGEVLANKTEIPSLAYQAPHNSYHDKQKQIFGYDWRGGSIGGLVTVQDKRAPFSLENFRARERVSGAAASGSNIPGDESARNRNSWNPFGGFVRDSTKNVDI